MNKRNAENRELNNGPERQLDSVDRTPFFTFTIIPTSNRKGSDKKTVRAKLIALLVALVLFALFHIVGIFLPDTTSNSLIYLAASIGAGLLGYNVLSSRYR